MKLYIVEEIVWDPEPRHVFLHSSLPEAVGADHFARDHRCLAQRKDIFSLQVVRDLKHKLIRELLEGICDRVPDAD